MTDVEFQRLIEEVRNGQTKGLDALFVEHYAYGVQWLTRKYQCGHADAEDVFMDAFLKFREALIKGKVVNDNIRGFLITVAKNLYLVRKKQNRIVSGFELDALEHYLGQSEGLYNDSFNPLLKQEDSQELDRKRRKRVDAHQKAWAKLSENCRWLLEGYHILGLKLKELGDQLNFNENTTKATKHRCKQTFQKWFNRFYTQV